LNDPLILRSTLRGVLALNPREERSETMLKLGMEAMLGLKARSLPVPDFQTALEWNHSRNLVEYRFDDEAEANFWKLTEHGKIKEGVK